MPNLIALAIPFFFIGIFVEARVARARRPVTAATIGAFFAFG